MAKTNRQLAEMILEFFANEDGRSAVDWMVDLKDAAREVLAAVDEPDGDDEIQATFNTAFANCIMERDKLRVEVGNMGVALGMVEGQRDDLLGLLRKMSIWADRLGSIAVNCGAIDRAVELDGDLEAADAAIDKCKTGEPGPTTQARYDLVDDCTIKLWFTEPEDLQKFVANYQPKDKPSA